VCVYRWTHCLLSRLWSLVWQGSDRSRIGWNSSPCALQMLVKWRDGHAHTRDAPWSSQTVGCITYSQTHQQPPATHTFLICFNVHLLLCYIWNTHRSKMNPHSSSVAGSKVTMMQNCRSSFRQTCKNTHANLQHMHHMYKHKHSNGAVQSFILYTHTLTHFVLSLFCCPPFLNASGNS